MSSSLGRGQFAAPPRTIGTSLAARMALGSARSQIGWLVLAFGSFLFWVVAWHADISAFRFSAGRVVQTQGEWLYCRETRFSVGGSEDERGTPIYENYFRYEVAGRSFTESSFATGACPGGQVVVEYLREQPEVSRIAGMRRNVFGPWAAMTAVVPAVGLLLVVAACVEGLTRVRLLRDGLLATGTLIEKTRTNIETSSGQVYRLTLEYTAQSGATGRVTTRTNRPERLEDKSGALLFYDPADLTRAVLLASLPGSIAADKTGQPIARPSRAFLVVPALTILGNVWYVYHHWIAGP
jgi:hypothetical protein